MNTLDGIVRRSQPAALRERRREKELLDVRLSLNILPDVAKVFSAMAVGLCVFVIWHSAGTSAAFSDDDPIRKQHLGTGEWIPELSVVVTPDRSKDSGAYADPPCVEFVSSLEDTTIYYEFSDDGDPQSGGTEYGGGCLDLPEDEKIRVQAVVVHNADDDWRSGIMYREFLIGNEEDDEEDESEKKKHTRHHFRRQHHDRDRSDDDNENGGKEDRGRYVETLEEPRGGTDIPTDSAGHSTVSSGSEGEYDASDAGHDGNTSVTESQPDEAVSGTEDEEKDPPVKENSDVSDEETAPSDEGLVPLTGA